VLPLLTHDILLLVAFPSYVYFPEYRVGEYEVFFENIVRFWRDIGVIYLGNPYEFMYDDRSLFYDTAYHMNDLGMTINTQKLIDLIRPYIERPRVADPLANSSTLIHTHR